MKNLKKVLALVLVVVMALGLITVSNAAFSDEATIEKKEAVDVLTAIGVINGQPDGSFQPEGDVTRAQMAKMISLILNKGEDVGELYKDACKFADVPASHWAAGHIAYCAQAGVINGKSETTFDPEGKVTGTEAAKMVLCALNYDAKVEGFVGASWAAAVLAKAAKINLVGSDANLTVNMGAPLDRQNAAQLLLNGLKADMVEYAAKGTTITTTDGMIINTGAAAATSQVAKDRTMATTQYKHIKNDAANVSGTNADYTIQLGEEMFKDLEIDATSTTDPFGRTIVTWKYDSNVVTEAPETATLVYKDTVTGGELYTALGKIDFYSATPTWTRTYRVDGVPTAFPTNIHSGDNNDIGVNGDVIEIYKNSDTKTLSIIRYDYHFAKINQVWEAEKDANGDVKRSAHVQLVGPTGTPIAADAADLTVCPTTFTVNTATIETDAFTTADKGAYVVYTCTPSTTTAGNVVLQSVVKAETVTGLFSGYVTGKSVTVGGTSYKSDPAVTYPALTKDATAYLDPNGNVIYLEGASSNDYAYLVHAAKTSGVETSMEAILVFTDGTRKTVTIAPNSETVAMTGTTVNKNLYAYRVDSNGKYEISAPAAAVATVATPTVTTPYETSTVKLGTTVKANNNTVFIVETYDSAATAATYATYTGITNVPTVDTAGYGTGWTGYATTTQGANPFVTITKTGGDGYAAFVYVFGAVTRSSSKDITALYLTATDAVADDGNGLYRTVKAVVKGEETTVKMTTGTTTAAWETARGTATGANLVITNNMTVDTNGYITAATPFAAADLRTYTDFVKDSTGVYTGTFSNGVIEFAGTPTTSYSVAESLPVYVYNSTTGAVTITTIGTYIPATVETLGLVRDTAQTGFVPAALYAIEH